VAMSLHCGWLRISLTSRAYAVRLPSGLDVDKQVLADLLLAGAGSGCANP
jgi:hypothetical protein